MWPNFRQALQASLDLLLPPACLLCTRLLSPGQGDWSLCAACLSRLPALGDASCRSCAQPYPLPYATDHLCSNCLTHPPPFTGVFAACSYQGLASEAIHRLKYRNQLPLAAPLGRRIAATLAGIDGTFRPELLIPVPLHPQRLRQRGYNQAMELARPLSHAFGIPIEPMLLRRTRHTQPQQGLSAAERRGNLRNAFYLAGEVQDRVVLLLDDVMTTGETVRECSRMLLAGGAGEVRVAVFARA